MDKSVDSIGSCSLNVDADSTDFSDTSGSLNLITPSSAKDITREFTSRIKERCQLVSQYNYHQSTAVLDPISGKITTIITSSPTITTSSSSSQVIPNIIGSNIKNENELSNVNVAAAIDRIGYNNKYGYVNKDNIVVTTTINDSSPSKKPSYLNLACCVNGYSNLTTYDSKLRQNISKSREVSTIRPSTNSFQYCKILGNFLVPPQSQSTQSSSSSSSSTLLSQLSSVPIPSVFKQNSNSSNQNYRLQHHYQQQQPSLFSSCFNNETMTDKKTTSSLTATHNLQEKTVISQSHDITDNVNNSTHFRSPKYYNNSVLISSSSSISTPITSEIKYHQQQNDLKSTLLTNNTEETITKSFIQQRVERLYGPGALVQGFYSPKKTPRSSYDNYSNNITTLSGESSTVLCERIKNAQNQYSLFTLNYLNQQNQNKEYNTDYYNNKNNTTNHQYYTNYQENSDNNDEEIENIQQDCDDLPVLRHLRPEFRAQLPILSPKRSINQCQQQKKQTTIENGLTIKSSTTTAKNNNTSNNINNINNNISIPIQPSSNSSNVTTIPTNNRRQITTIMTNTCINNDQYLNGNNKSLIYEQQQQLQQEIINDSKRIKNDDIKNSSTNKISVKLVNKFNEKDENCLNINTTTSKQHLSNPQLNFKNNPAVDKEKELGIQTKMEKENLNLSTSLEEKKPNIQMATNINTTEDGKLVKINNNNIRDGHYFLELLKTEQHRLLDLAAQSDKEIENLSSNLEISDDIIGYLRSASGKARLLVSQKMKQFEGLCNNNLKQLPDEKFPTTVEDLQGFWDMVLLQVNNVDSLFKEIDNLKANGWKKLIQKDPRPPSGSKLLRKPNLKLSGTSSSSSSLSTRGSASSLDTSCVTLSLNSLNKKSGNASLIEKKREVQRKQLMELKRKNRQQQDKQKFEDNNIEIFVSENLKSNNS